jgi:hypothetical protein
VSALICATASLAGLDGTAPPLLTLFWLDDVKSSSVPGFCSSTMLILS